MIVLDAPVVVELLTNGSLAEPLRAEIAARNDVLVVPHLLDVEVVTALRNLVSGGRIDAFRGTQFLTDLAELPAYRCPHEPLPPRVWELRNSFTAYDAVYIALAEATEAVLFTRPPREGGLV